MNVASRFATKSAAAAAAAAIINFCMLLVQRQGFGRSRQLDSSCLMSEGTFNLVTDWQRFEQQTSHSEDRCAHTLRSNFNPFTANPVKALQFAILA